MLKTNAPDRKNTMRVIKQCGLILSLIIILITIIIVADNFENRTAGQPISIKLVAGPLSYCTFTLLENKDSRYTVTFAKGYDEIIEALKEGIADAALLPVEYLNETNGVEFTILAVTSYLNLVAIENCRSVASIYDLEGHCIVIPDSVQSLPEMEMLNLLLSHANIHVNPIFENNEYIEKRVKDGNFDIIILPVEQCAPVLLYSNRYRSYFNLVNQWSMLFGSQPPAGSYIIMRNACIEEKHESVIALLTTIRNSINFLKSHNKKSAMLIADVGLGDDLSYITKTISHCMLVYLEDKDMADSINQFSTLTATR